MDIIKNFKRNKTAFMASILKRVPFLVKDDELYLKLLFLFEMHYWPDLKHPKTFNEKLQWLKLHNRKPEFTTMVDKYAVKKYVADRIGEQYIIPTLGVWDSFDQIDFDSLPNQFVLKTTHGGGGLAVVICKDKKTFDKRRAKRSLENSLNSELYMKYREWPYKDVPKRIIAEKYMVDESGTELKDYKFFCFNGVADNVMVCIDRQIHDTKFYFFDKKWNLLPLNIRGKNTDPSFKLPRPECIEQMFDLAGRLSEGVPFLRVDFYSIDNHPYFGELTFFPDSGFDANLLPETDKMLGERTDLSIVKPSKH